MRGKRRKYNNNITILYIFRNIILTIYSFQSTCTPSNAIQSIQNTKKQTLPLYYVDHQQSDSHREPSKRPDSQLLILFLQYATFNRTAQHLVDILRSSFLGSRLVAVTGNVRVISILAAPSLHKQQPCESPLTLIVTYTSYTHLRAGNVGSTHNTIMNVTLQAQYIIT